MVERCLLAVDKDRAARPHELSNTLCSGPHGRTSHVCQPVVDAACPPVEDVERARDALQAQHVVAVGGDVYLVQHLRSLALARSVAQPLQAALLTASICLHRRAAHMQSLVRLQLLSAHQGLLLPWSRWRYIASARRLHWQLIAHLHLLLRRLRGCLGDTHEHTTRSVWTHCTVNWGLGVERAATAHAAHWLSACIALPRGRFLCF